MTTATPASPEPQSSQARSYDELDSVEAVLAGLSSVGYLPDERIATTVYLALRLGRPLLLEGPAGVGKTELARSLGLLLERRVVRLQCYESQDEARALYEWDYGKQLLYTQILREKIAEVVGDAADLEESVERIAASGDVFFSSRFLSERPILEAMRSPEPVVLLIDEVDRSDEALEAVMLEALAENQISIPELGTIAAEHPPLVLLTSNNTRDLSSALKRRCLHLFLDYPDLERETEIVASKKTGLDDALARELVELVHELRGLELRKAPSIAETVDWARTLAVLGTTEMDPGTLENTANVVMKYEQDLDRAVAHIRARAAGQDVDEAPPVARQEPTASMAAPGDGSWQPTTPPDRRRPPPPDLSNVVEDDTDVRGVRSDKERPHRHGAAAFFGGRGSSDAAGSPSRRRPV